MAEYSSKLAFMAADASATCCGCVVFCNWTEEIRFVQAALQEAGVPAIDIMSFRGEIAMMEREPLLGKFRQACARSVSSLYSC